MKLDERFMTILTALLLMVGFGAIMHRGEDGGSIFSGNTDYQPKPDTFTLRAGRVQSLDVLLNDTNTDQIDPLGLTITKDPACGRALAANGAIQYSESDRCVGEVALSYCVPFGGACEASVVTLTILNEEELARRNPTDGSPVVFDVIQQGNAPSEQPPLLAMKQPMRLTMPDNSEVITPAQAAQDVRAIGMEPAPTVVAENQSDTAVRVSNTSARSGSVSTSSVTMTAPSLDNQELELALAAPAAPAATPRRPGAPGGLSASPGGFGAPGGLSAPSSPSSGLSAPSSPGLPSSPSRPGAPAAPTPAAPVVAAAPAPQAPAPQAPAPQPAETEVASVAPSAQDNQPIAPKAPETHDDAGVLDSLARSNTVIGATFSAAKALFSPSDRQIESEGTESGDTAPRPEDFEIIAGLDAEFRMSTLDRGDLPREDLRPKTATGVAGIAFASLNYEEDGFTRKTQPAAPLFSIGRPGNTAGEATATEDAPVVAALTPDPASPATGTDVGERDAATCEVEMSLKVDVGAEIVGTLVSPCRPSSQFLVEHSGLSFSAETDADGVANFIVPAMEPNAVVSATFEDGGATVAQTTVDNMSRMVRVAVMWSDDLDFDLDAREFGAAVGSDEHIRRDNQSNYRAARRQGGGYLTVLGPQQGEGHRAEVYTIFQSTRTKAGVIDLELTLAEPTAACPEVTVIRTLRTEAARLVRDRDIQLNLGSCSETQKVVVGSALRDIRIARN